MPAIEIPKEAIESFCRRWRVRELALFGSVLRDDFRPGSDVDVLISFAEDAPWSSFDLVTMQDELEKVFGRSVDLVEREGLRNPFRRNAILASREVLHAA